MNKLPIVLFLLVILTQFAALSGQSLEGVSPLSQGISLFNSGAYSKAHDIFKSALEKSSDLQTRGDLYYWLSKTGIILRKYQEAEKYVESFLLNYENHKGFQEILYQKGRLLYFQKEYESSIQVFNLFIDSFPDSPYVGSSYYWTGECLFALGRMDEAAGFFKSVMENFPGSFKVEAAKYRFALIEYEEREQELLKFLKWSHEESLRSQEDFQLREKTYEQAIAFYQKKLSSSGIEPVVVQPAAQTSSTDSAQEITRLVNELAQKDLEIEALNQKITELKNQSPGSDPQEPGEGSVLEELNAMKAELTALKKYFELLRAEAEGAGQ